MESKNLFSIGETAKIVGITRKTILGYEAKGLILPDKKNGETGNRYYTADTLTRVRTIRALQNFGLTLNEIREYYSGAGDLQPIIQRMKKMRDELNLTIEKLEERASNQVSPIREITLEPHTVYYRTCSSVSTTEKASALRDTFIDGIRKYGANTNGRMLATEYSRDNPHLITCCVSVPDCAEGTHIKRLKKGRGLSVLHHGAYEDVPQVREKIIGYAEEHNIKLSGIFRNVYIEGPPQHNDKSKYITQIIAVIE